PACHAGCTCIRPPASCSTRRATCRCSVRRVTRRHPGIQRPSPTLSARLFMSQDELAGCIGRIDELVTKIESLADPAVREDVQDIVDCLLRYHAAAVARLITVL